MPIGISSSIVRNYRPFPPVVTGASVTKNGNGSFVYQIIATNNPTSYSASGLPDGLSIDTSTGLITGTTPDVTTTQSYTMTIGAANAAGSSTATLSINVKARPVILNLPTTKGYIYNTGLYSFQVTKASSGIERFWTYTAISGPAGAITRTTTVGTSWDGITGNNTNVGGLFGINSNIPKGTYTIDVYYTDTYGRSDTQTFTVMIV